jgi:hypothetical protein
MSEEPGREIALRDELLELLYWLEGEGFAEHATVAGMRQFVAWPEDDVRAALASLVARGDVSATADSERFRLTDVGRREAARRFADDFAPLLRQGHGECSDPDCDCHTNPAGAAECHARDRAR